MKVTLIDYTRNPEVTIGRAAGICYDSDPGEAASLRRAVSCRDKGHLATMRFAYASFHIEGMSRICSHQIVRLAHAGILQQSQRYVKASEVQFVTPPSFAAIPQPLEARWEALQEESRSLYNDLMQVGIKKEDARFTLLHSAETSMNMCLNFQAWQDFLRNRTDKAAQWEVRAIALEIQKHLAEIAPNLFGVKK